MFKFINDWINNRKYYENCNHSDPRYDHHLFKHHFDDRHMLHALSTCNDNLREKARNKKISRFKTMGRLTKYKNYYPFYDGKKVRVKVVKHDFTKSKFKDVLRLHKKKGDVLPLPVNKVSKVVGIFKGKVRNSTYTTKFFQDTTALSYLRTINPEFNNMVNTHDFFVQQGSFKFTCPNLRDMATDHVKKYSYTELVNGYLSRIGNDLCLPKLKTIKPEYINGLKSNPKSFPGILTALRYGQRRQRTIKYTKRVAQEYMKQIMYNDQQILDTSYLFVGGREKRIKVQKGIKKDVVKTRCVLGQEDIPTLISTCLSKSLNEGFQRMDAGFNYGGRVNGRLNHRKLSELLKIDDRKDINFNVDFSGHDNHVSEEAIVTSFALLRLCYEESVYIDRLFQYILSGMVFKRIVLPESNMIYQISKGIASGHGMTNIINTMCSYGTFATGINNICNDKDIINRTKVVMAGDDVIGKLPIEIVTPLSNELKENSGMILDDVVKTTGHINSYNNASRNTFLKKKYLTGGISWNELELFINLSFPTSRKMTPIRCIDNYAQMIYMAPFDLDLTKILKNLITIKIYEHSINEYNKRHIFKPSNIKRTRITDFFKINAPPVGYVDRFVVGENIKNFHFPSYWSMYGVDVLLETGAIVKAELKKINDKHNIKLRWFDLRRVFKKHENQVRLKVFDVNKIFIKAHKYRDNTAIRRLYYINNI